MWITIGLLAQTIAMWSLFFLRTAAQVNAARSGISHPSRYRSGAGLLRSKRDRFGGGTSFDQRNRILSRDPRAVRSHRIAPPTLSIRSLDRL